MSIATKIKTIIETLNPDATCILASKFYANVASHPLTTAELPYIVLDNEIVKDAEIQLNNNVIKSTKILISFLDLDRKSYSDNDREGLRQAMEDRADRVAVNIYQLPEVRPDGNQKYRINPMFHAFNTDLTGVTLEMIVNENVIVNFCSTILEE